MSRRIVLLIVSNHPPMQIQITDPDRYGKMRAQLKNFQEYESAEPDPELPLISLEQMAVTFRIPLPPQQTSGGLLRILRSAKGE
jgi:hypothetical protein